MSEFTSDISSVFCHGWGGEPLVSDATVLEVDFYQDHHSLPLPAVFCWSLWLHAGHILPD